MTVVVEPDDEPVDLPDDGVVVVAPDADPDAEFPEPTAAGTDAAGVEETGLWTVVAPGTVVVVPAPATTVVADATVVVVAWATVVVVVVVAVAVLVQIANSVRPPGGIRIDSFFEYGTPPPPANVSQRERMCPVRVKPDPLLRTSGSPPSAYWVATVPDPPFAL